MKLSYQIGLVLWGLWLGCMPSYALTQVVKVHQLTVEGAQGVGEVIGTLTLEDTALGLKITPSLTDIAPGLHGFHVHSNPACGWANKNDKPVLGLAAGGHFDPLHSNQHRGPYEQDGHLGDLPPLYSDEQHKITGVVLAPRLTLDMIAQRSLIIHQYGDNFSDHPEPLGGGNARIACGIIR